MLPGGKSNVKREIRIHSATAATRSKSSLKANRHSRRCSPPFSHWLKFPPTIADDSAESGSQHGKVGNLFIAGGTYQSWAEITIIVIFVRGCTGHFEVGKYPPHSLVEKTPETQERKEQGRLSLFFPLFSESNFVYLTKPAELTLPTFRMP
jgi:hypothetical protein